jgi:HAD superfamily hydrolase (TIGR01484 family)
MPEPLASFPIADRRNVSVVLTDIDDTLTEHGRLPPLAYTAMAELQAAGLAVIPVTGRPAGWCDLIARQWPVAGVVGENGAFYFRYDDERREMTRHHAKSAVERAADRVKLLRISEEVLAEVPGARVAADQAFREADLAIDFCEDVPALPPGDIARILAVFSRHGAAAKVSSIHVNGWFGSYDKLSMSRTFLADALALDIDRTPERVVFVGDSPNDAPMFAFFPNAVGVANVLDFGTGLETPPRWITRQRSARGFREVADALLAR